MKLEHQVGGHANLTSNESGTLIKKPATLREIGFYKLLHSMPAPPKGLEVPPVNSAVPSLPNSISTSAAASSAGSAYSLTRQDNNDNGEGDARSLYPREFLLGHLKRFCPRFWGTITEDDDSGPKPLTTRKLNSGFAGDDRGSIVGRATSLVTSVDCLTECVILSNLTIPFFRPCIMDIKLGTVLYDATDSSVTEAKRLKMEEQSRTRTSGRMGMSITGLQRWNEEQHTYIYLDRPTCRKLQPEDLVSVFADFWSVSTTTAIPALSLGPEGNWTQGGVATRGEGDGRVLLDEVQANPPGIAVTTEGIIEVSPSKDFSETTQSDLHRFNIKRTLLALLATLEKFYALVSHLEIRFIGTSLLIIYEGDASRLRHAWRWVDQGRGSGDGLCDDRTVGEVDDRGSNLELNAEGGALFEPARNGLPARKRTERRSKSSFAGRVDDFAPERDNGSQESGLQDGDLLTCSRPRSSQTWTLPTPTNDEEHDMHADRDESDDYSNEERYPGSDASDHVPRPFTVRLIDFAHTRLADGEGPDLGFLQGVRTIIELVQGRIQDLS